VQVLHEKFEKDPEVFVLAVHFDGKGDPAGHLAEKNYTFPLIPNGSGIASNYGVKKIPTFLVIDRQGTIRHISTGQLTNDRLDELELAALEARAER
jgi:hypothetical protein